MVELQRYRREALKIHGLEHVWQDWNYVMSDSCEQRRTCGRCFARESRSSHQWDSWQADAFMPCYSIVRCSRCGAAMCAEAERLQHIVGPVPIP